MRRPKRFLADWTSRPLCLAVFLPLLFAGGHQPPAGPAAALECTGAVQHPLQIRIDAGSTIERGVPLEVRVVVAGQRTVPQGEVRLVSAGGAAVLGAERAALRPAGFEREADAVFRVVLPPAGHRFYLQFEAEADQEGALYRRGAALNLLPDGPLDPGRAALSGSGEAVLEFQGKKVTP